MADDDNGDGDDNEGHEMITSRSNKLHSTQNSRVEHI